jgi:hypothetical protein
MVRRRAVTGSDELDLAPEPAPGKIGPECLARGEHPGSDDAVGARGDMHRAPVGRGRREHDVSEYFSHYAVSTNISCMEAPHPAHYAAMSHRTLVAFDAKKKPWRPCREARALGL